MKYLNKYYVGVFWKAKNEERKIIGTLYIDNEGCAIIASLQSLSKDKHALDWKKTDLILGYIKCQNDSNTYSLKLYDVYKVGDSIGALNMFKYKSCKVFLADHYDENIREVYYNTVMINSEKINDWIPITGFKFDVSDNENFEVSHFYSQPEQIDLFKNDNFFIYIYFRANASFPVNRKSSIQEEIFINIETDKQKEINELFHIKGYIEHLLSILLFVPFHSDHVELRSVSGKTYKSISKQQALEFHLRNELKFEQFRQNSQKIISAWLDKQLELELIIKNFFSVYGQKGVLVENKFLTYISVLEKFHDSNIDIEKTKRVIEEYGLTLPVNDKGKEIVNLVHRLIYFLHSSKIRAKIDDVVEYAKKLKTTRHYHTHLEDKHKENSLSEKDIRSANKILEFVIQELLLKEIGIDSEHLRIDCEIKQITTHSNKSKK